MHPKQQFVMAATNEVNMDDHGGKEDAAGGKNVSTKSLNVSHSIHSLHDDPFYTSITCLFLPCPMSHDALLPISAYIAEIESKFHPHLEVCLFISFCTCFLTFLSNVTLKHMMPMNQGVDNIGCYGANLASPLLYAVATNTNGASKCKTLKAKHSHRCSRRFFSIAFIMMCFAMLNPQVCIYLIEPPHNKYYCI